MMLAIANAPECVTELLVALSHDLRAPMSAILLWETILREHGNNSGMRERALDAIRASVAEQSSLIAELSDVSSLLAGTLELERESVLIDPMLRAAITPVLATARAKDLDVEVEWSGQLGSVVADRERLRRALDHVIAGAVRISPARQPFSISARRTRDTVELAVGQVPCSQQACADPRVRTELRLIIARELIALHGGTLDCSQHTTGIVFSISLPRG